MAMKKGICLLLRIYQLEGKIGDSHIDHVLSKHPFYGSLLILYHCTKQVFPRTTRLMDLYSLKRIINHA